MQYPLGDEKYLFRRCLMDFDELALSMTVETAPTVIYKEKWL